MSRKESRFFTVVALVGNVVFMIAMLYFTCFIGNILKKDFETNLSSEQ